MKQKILIIISLLCLFCLIASIFFMFKCESKDLTLQESNSQVLAEKYLISVSEQTEVLDQVDPTDSQSEQSFSSDFEYDDERIYSYFKEEWAKGYVDSVLEIPKIDLRQSIFTGTVEQINHDLSHWLSVTARSDYILGDTHYCIYMHNPRDRSIQISKAQYELDVGDYMVVTKDQKVYFYEIDDIYPEWRNKCSDEIVNNMTVSPTKLYIFTCGRDDWRGRNLVIEGSISEIYDLSDWNENKDRYIYEYNNKNIEPEDELRKKDLILDVSVDDNKIKASIRSADYVKLENCTLGVFNTDGYLINENDVIYWEGSPITIDNLGPGEYYIGVYECEGYNMPSPYKITIAEDNKTYTQDVIEIEEESNVSLTIVKSIAIVMLCLTLLMGVFLLFGKKR